MSFTITWHDRLSRQPIPDSDAVSGWRVYPVARCDLDGSLVGIEIDGTCVRSASCEKGHHWLAVEGLTTDDHTRLGEGRSWRLLEGADLPRASRHTSRGVMLEARNPVEVITTLRTAQRLLTEQAEELRRLALSQADYGNWGSTERYRQILDTAADLGALADQIAVEVER